MTNSIAVKKGADALRTVVTRNEFYRDGYRRSTKLAIAGLAAGAVSILVAGTLAFRQVEPRYFATTAAGTLTPMIPLDRPAMELQGIMSWATDCVVRIHTLDFVNYRTNLTAANRCFTPEGWKNYDRALAESRNLVALVEQKKVSTAVPESAPILKASGIAGGVMAWRLEIPILVTYQSASDRLQQRLVADVLLVRRPTTESPDGIGIQQLIERPAS